MSETAAPVIDHAAMHERRRVISQQYLRGSGIEVGALHQPLWIDPAVQVTYVDRMTNDELRKQYPELKDYSLTRVDRIDDGEKLNTFADDSLDFIVANHMLEHCENPLGTIRSHLRKLKSGGVLYYAIPDKRFTFDINRSLTEWDHFVNDDKQGPEGSRWGHFVDYIEKVHRIPHPESEVHAKGLLNRNYSIHFHVWNRDTFGDFLSRASAYLNDPFDLALIEQNQMEVVVVLRRK